MNYLVDLYCCDYPRDFARKGIQQSKKLNSFIGKFTVKTHNLSPILVNY